MVTSLTTIVILQQEPVIRLDAFLTQVVCNLCHQNRLHRLRHQNRLHRLRHQSRLFHLVPDLVQPASLASSTPSASLTKASSLVSVISAVRPAPAVTTLRHLLHHLHLVVMSVNLGIFSVALMLLVINSVVIVIGVIIV
jgi:hypothetical protein